MSDKKEIKTIKLSDCEVDIVTRLTWEQKERVEASIISGAKMMNFEGKPNINFDGDAMLEAKIKLLEICVKEIREGEDKKQFSREWVSSLSIEDGDKLYQAVEEITKKK